jgi:EAL domain-containing protein (putative c-di-GMP-specific phosphodiesterase class I)
MFDVLVRMLDHQGKEVLPAEFMAAAERNDLLKNIDRWVVGASLSFAAKGKPGCLFVASRATACSTLASRLAQDQLANGSHKPERICFQITETIAEQYMNAATGAARALKKWASASRSSVSAPGRDPYKLLRTVPLDFIKIDGALDQDLAGNFETQTVVKKLVETGRQAQDRDHRRTRRGREHHGSALAARCAVHPGLLRQCAGRGHHGRGPVEALIVSRYFGAASLE